MNTTETSTAGGALQDGAAAPSLLSANLLYLTGMIAVLLAGGLLQAWHFGWGLLATELIIGALAFLWARLTRQPLRPTFRLYPARASLLLFALVMGLGVWLVDTWLGALTTFVLGYDVPVPPGIYPQSVPAVLLLFAGLVIAAPLCEELMFRGYIQSAYERLRPTAAIIFVALLFSVFHLSLLGLPPRIPVALALGYVVWRSGSLWPGVVLHAANNLLAVVVLGVAGLQPGLLERLPVGTLPSAGAGLLLLAAGWWLFGRAAGPRPAAPTTSAGPSRSQLAQGLPLVVALLVFAGVAALEVVAGRYPELLATGPVTLQEAPWQEPQRLHYDLLHAGGEKVGESSCELGRDGALALATCTIVHGAYEYREGNSFWSSAAGERTFSAAYRAADMGLVTLSDRQQFEGHTVTVDVAAEGDSLLLRVDSTISGPSSTEMGPYALVNELWPLQLSALPFRAGAAYEGTLIFPERWDNDLQRNVLTVTDTAVVTGGAEPLTVPAGDFLAWRVQAGSQTAWYDAEPPHRLLRYDGPMLSWRLAAHD
jgi:membrane protease YdiL (CAAX protease family)